MILCKIHISNFLKRLTNTSLDSNPYAYISMIGRNLAINTYNKQKRIIRSDELLESIPAEKDVEPNEDIFKILDLLTEDERSSDASRY